MFYLTFCFSKGNSYRVPRHEKKEHQQLSPVKKRVKESSPPHQQRYQRAAQCAARWYRCWWGGELSFTRFFTGDNCWCSFFSWRGTR